MPLSTGAYRQSSSSVVPEKTSSRTWHILRCLSATGTPVPACCSQRHVARSTSSMHRRRTAAGQTRRTASPGASRSAVMTRRGPAAPRPPYAAAVPTSSSSIRRPRPTAASVSAVVTNEPGGRGTDGGTVLRRK